VKIVVANETVVPIITPIIVERVEVASGTSANTDVAETTNAAKANANNERFFFIFLFLFLRMRGDLISTSKSLSRKNQKMHQTNRQKLNS
jgi:hypothetical protein